MVHIFLLHFLICGNVQNSNIRIIDSVFLCSFPAFFSKSILNLHSQFYIYIAAIQSCYQPSYRSIILQLYPLHSIFHKNIDKICAPFLIYKQFSIQLDTSQFFYSSSSFYILLQIEALNSCIYFSIMVLIKLIFVHNKSITYTSTNARDPFRIYGKSVIIKVMQCQK